MLNRPVKKNPVCASGAAWHEIKAVSLAPNGNLITKDGSTHQITKCNGTGASTLLPPQAALARIIAVLVALPDAARAYRLPSKRLL
jgi:hypothetical protein